MPFQILNRPNRSAVSNSFEYDQTRLAQWVAVNLQGLAKYFGPQAIATHRGIQHELDGGVFIPPDPLAGEAIAWSKTPLFLNLYFRKQGHLSPPKGCGPQAARQHLLASGTKCCLSRLPR